uniref:Rhamnogalacturonan endolyase n=1 Tax=Aegilops tauschii TaxID=37682 RepID=R7WAQ2_AEGTA
MPARAAYVGLAAPGQLGSWATESKGYQFWTTASNTSGKFTIDNVRAGEYNLYAWVPGLASQFADLFQSLQDPTPTLYCFVDDLVCSIFNFETGGAINLGDLVYEAPRSGPTLWEIGVPDRSAKEMFVPDPDPKYLNKLFQNKDMYRQYGLWERYAQLYPTDDLVYTVGESHHSKDWYFAHVTRKVGDDIVPTTRQIRFNLDRVLPGGTYTLRVALAAAHAARLQFQVNGATRRVGGVFGTPAFGDGNAIARHGDHGTQWSLEFPISGRLLREGDNTIHITQTRANSIFLGVMYDYIRRLLCPDVLFEPYFSPRFRIRETMFNRLYNDVRAYDDYFILKKDGIVNIGFSGDQKYMTAKDACLWHGRRFVGRVPLMSESTCLKAMVSIYPSWATFVKNISGPRGKKRPRRMERTFRVFQARFAVV